MLDAPHVVMFRRAKLAGLTVDDLRQITYGEMLLYIEADEWANADDDARRGGVNPFFA